MERRKLSEEIKADIGIGIGNGLRIKYVYRLGLLTFLLVWIIFNTTRNLSFPDTHKDEELSESAGNTESKDLHLIINDQQAL